MQYTLNSKETKIDSLQPPLLTILSLKRSTNNSVANGRSLLSTLSRKSYHLNKPILNLSCLESLRLSSRHFKNKELLLMHQELVYASPKLPRLPLLPHLPLRHQLHQLFLLELLLLLTLMSVVSLLTPLKYHLL